MVLGTQSAQREFSRLVVSSGSSFISSLPCLSMLNSAYRGNKTAVIAIPRCCNSIGGDCMYFYVYVPQITVTTTVPALYYTMTLAPKVAIHLKYNMCCLQKFGVGYETSDAQKNNSSYVALINYLNRFH